jgi:hypothetical protein
MEALYFRFPLPYYYARAYMYLPIITTAVAIESQVCEFDIASSSISLILLFLCFLREKEKKLCGEALRRLKQ